MNLARTDKLVRSLMTLGLLAATLGYTPISHSQDTPDADDATTREIQPPLVTITGSGKAGYIPLWHNSSEITVSNIFQGTSGTTKGFVGIGTTDPTNPFQVNAAEASSYGYLALFTNSTSDINTIIGVQSPNGGTNIGVDQNGGSYLYSSKGSIYLGPDGTNTLWVGNFGCGNTCNGYVGMQTSTPQNPLDVAGSVAIGSYGGVDAAPSDGMIVSGYVGIGTPAPTNLLTLVKGGGPAIADGWSTYSSRRWKTNIQTLHGALAKVEKLRGVTYDQKDSGKHEVGVIAEEVGAVVPELVIWDKNGKDAQGVDYSRLTALLIEATKEQQIMISNQQNEIKREQAELKHLSAQMRTVQDSLRTSGRTTTEVHIAKMQYQ